jgi:hypothetical protein
MDDGSGEVVFAKPHEEKQSFEDFLEFVTKQEKDKDFPVDSEVRYAQTRKFKNSIPSRLHATYRTQKRGFWFSQTRILQRE